VITEGLRLMVVGMTMVFAFLLLLVLVTTAIGRFFQAYGRYFPDLEPELATVPAAAMQAPAASVIAQPAAAPAVASVQSDAEQRARVVAAVAAIHAHRTKQRER
jgi:sodium pump decarboxylase gamma subunit